MFRKTLAILSLIGLLLSVGLWAVSYWGLYYRQRPLYIEVCEGQVRLSRRNTVGAEWWEDSRISAISRRIEEQWEELESSQSQGIAEVAERERLLGEERWLKTEEEALNRPRLWIGLASSRVLLVPNQVYFVPRFQPQWSVATPLWMPTVSFALLTAGLFSLPFYLRRKHRLLGRCVKCGYDLRGSTERCPECGARFSDENPGSK